MNWKLLASSLLAGAMLASAPAAAADFIRTAPRAAVYVQPSVCSSHGLLATIDSKFDYRARSYLHSNLDIVDFYGAHEIYARPSDPTHLVGRTWCEATALLNTNRTRSVWYLVETTWGFAGVGDSVEYCVSGLDPWHVYGADCASLRRFHD
jgi:hypothetical protein